MNIAIDSSNIFLILEKLADIVKPYHPALPTEGSESLCAGRLFRRIAQSIGPVQCYLNVAEDIGLLSNLETRILSLDPQVIYSHSLANF